MSTPVIVCGRTGRMSRLIAEAVTSHPALTLRAHLASPGRSADGPPSERTEGTAGSQAGVPVVADLAAVPGGVPVVVDFTDRQFTAAVAQQAMTTPCALVVGTSGLIAQDRTRLAAVARRRAVVVAANFSLTLLTVARFVRELSRTAGDGWDAGVLDVHFAGKKDAPSATARLLAEQWSSGDSGRAQPHIASFRLGDAVSEHRVEAAGRGEYVTVAHRVADRSAFLPGILHAVRFAASAPAGLYTLEDVACAAPA